VAGAGLGGGPQVNVYDPRTNALEFSFMAYDPRFLGGVRVATGDVNGDGIPDIITAPGPSGGPDIRVFDGRTGQMIEEFMAYDPRWTGGVNLAVADVNHDGFADIITAPDFGGLPQVRVFSGRDLTPIYTFMAYSTFFTGGVNVAAGDVNGDGFADIITGAGFGGGPNVRVFDGRTGSQMAGAIGNFMAYDPHFLGGVYVAAGDVEGDGKADVITGAGAGGGPQVNVFSGTTGQLIRSFFAASAGTLFYSDGNTFRSGVRVAAVDITGSGKADIVTSFGVLGYPLVQAFDPTSLMVVDALFAFNPGFRGGVYVGAQ
jgi:hypothetical protein